MGTSPETVTNNVGTLAANLSAGGALTFTNRTTPTDNAPLVIGSVLGTNGITAVNGNITINASSSLNVTQPITTGAANSTANVHIGLGVTPGTLPTTPNVAADAGTAITLNRTDVNDPPVTQGSTIVAAQNTLATPFSYTFHSATSRSAIRSIRRRTTSWRSSSRCPGLQGTIKDGATTINSGDSVLATHIAAGQVTYTPILNDGAANPYTNFQFQVQDDGGIANSGQDLSGQATITVRLIVANKLRPAPIRPLR